MPGDSALAFQWLKMAIFCDEVQTPSDFSYTTSCRCWQTRAPVWTNFGWLTAKGGRLNFNHSCSVAVIEVHQPKLLSFGLYFTPATYEARIFDVLFKTLYGIVRYRTNTYMLCVFGQCGVLGFPFGTTTSTPTIVS